MALTADTLAAESGARLEWATRVLPVAVQLVEDYAPAAPEVLKDEAALRVGGYLLGSDYGPIRQETIGPLTREYVTKSRGGVPKLGGRNALDPVPGAPWGGRSDALALVEAD